jgi:hypothetical protein
MASLVERVTQGGGQSTATARPCKKALREAVRQRYVAGAPCHHQASRQAHGDGAAPSVARRDGAGAPPCSRIYASASMIEEGASRT